MKNIFKILTISVALLTAIAIFTSCDQLIDDPKDFFEYWTSEVIPKGFSISGPKTTNSEGSLCVPSGAPVTVTINLHNPRKFKLVMPTNSADAHNIIRFPGFSGYQPEYSSPGSITGDYTLTQTADDKLELTYKSSFLKKYEWSSKNIGPEITFISTDGRKFSKKFSLNLKVDTPPKLSSMVTIGKTTQDGKDYYVIILKAEDMTETAGTPSGLLHKEIKMLSVTPGTGDSTSLNIAFTGTSGFPTGDRLLAAGAVNSLGSGEGPGTISSLISDTWALRYRTDTEVKAASKTYTFTLIDEKGLKSSPITVPTPLLKAEDVQLSYGTPPNTIPASINPPPNPYTINAGLSDTEVTVTAKTATSGAKITGKVEKQDGRSWVLVNNSIDSGSWDEVNILLPAPEYDQEVLYKISLTAGGDGFDAGTEKTFFVKVTKNTTITISSSESDAWTKLKTEVEKVNGPSKIIISGTITALSGANIITVNRAVTIQGSNKARDKLNGGNQIRIFHVWTKGDLKLEKLTLLNGKSDNTYPGGGAIYCTGGKLTTEDVIIQNCNAKNGGAIYAKDAELGYESTPSVITLKNTQIKSCAATGTGAEDGRGGAICCIKSSLTLNNTTIGGSVPADGNTARRGGGIYFAFEEGMLDVSAGNFISYNKATNTSGATVGGGGVYVQSGTFTLGGTVSHNEASDSTAWLAGGGVYVGPKAKFIMKAGATISGNLAAGGGGVYIHADRYAGAGSFTMEGGTILGCHAGGPGFTNAQGGGVYIKADGSKKGSFTMKGGTIDGCTVTVKSDKIATGGGVYVGAGAVFTMEKYARVTPSTGSDANVKGKNDIYLANGAKITINEKLESSAVARITPGSYPTSSNPNIQVLQNPAGNTTNVAENYFKFTVTSDSNTNTAYCVNEAGLIRQQVDTTPYDGDSQNWAKLKAAIESAGTNTVIYVRDVCYARSGSDTITVDNKTITLIGLTSGHVSLNASDQKCRIFTIKNGGNLTIKNMELKGHAKDGKGGGGILLENDGNPTSLTLENVSITSCRTSGNGTKHGAGIAIYKGTVTMKGKTQISDCKSLVYGCWGGGVYIGAGGTLTIDGYDTTNNNDKTYIRSCEAAKGGGVYIASGGKLELKQGQLSLNRVTDTPKKGIAVYNDSGTFNWTGGTIEYHGTNGTVIEGSCNNTSGNTAN